MLKKHLLISLFTLPGSLSVRESSRRGQNRRQALKWHFYGEIFRKKILNRYDVRNML